MVAPAPTKNPIKEDRSVAPVDMAASFILNIMRPLARTTFCPPLVDSSISNISLTKKRPITTTTTTTTQSVIAADYSGLLNC
ncbi:hypothetical protein EIO60_02743|nr:hypothetical protein [Candidatus Pantoea persica]